MTRGAPRKLVGAALRGEPQERTPCGPLAVHFTARHAGVSLRRYTTEAQVLADCVIRYHERFHPDAVWVSADTWVTAEAMGAPVAFPPGDQPLGGTGEPRVCCARDVDRIPPAQPGTQGRMPLMLEALNRVVEALGDEVFVVACCDQAPFSLACALMGIENLMVKLIEDRPGVEALLERCIEYAAAYGEAMARCGADLISTGDSPVGLIGPQRYQSVALPAERRLFERLRERTGLPLSLHVCGDSSRILADMATSGADILEVDSQVDLAAAREELGPGIVLWGNLDAAGLLTRGTPQEVERAARQAIADGGTGGGARFVLSSGCALSPDTPPENLDALLRASGTADYS